MRISWWLVATHWQLSTINYQLSMSQATAAGKIILFGEHAVVYGRSAIAAPISQLRATAVIQSSQAAGVRFIAPDLAREMWLASLSANDALGMAVRLVQQAANLSQLPNITITVHSDIPIASGLGSGAAISAAIIRALADYLNQPHLLEPKIVSQLTYEVEKIHHGTPSGIDNTVVAYEQPVYFVRRQPTNLIAPFVVKRPLTLLIGNTGVRSSTKTVVMDVRRQWESDPDTFNALFDECDNIAEAARIGIEQGHVTEIGRLMSQNHSLLQKMSVSSSELDKLVEAAITAGALGAKLSGAGRGGNMIALVTPEMKTAVTQTLLTAGATSVLSSNIK